MPGEIELRAKSLELGRVARARRGRIPARVGLRRLAVVFAGALAVGMSAGAVFAQPATTAPKAKPPPKPRPTPEHQEAGSVTVIRSLQAYDVGIQKSGVGAVVIGQVATFTLSTFNSGSSTVNASSGVTVSDSLPAAFSAPVVATGASWNCTVSGTNVHCQYAGPPVGPNSPLPPITIKATATTPGAYANCATIAVATGPDSNRNNNQSCSKGAIQPSRSQDWDLGVVKTGPSSVSLGQTVSFAIVVRNYGPPPAGAADGVYIQDGLPIGFGPAISAAGTHWICSLGYTNRCDYSGPVVAANADFPTITIVAAATSATHFHNCAGVAAWHLDTRPSNNQSCIDGDILPAPYDVGLTKSVTNPLAAGQTATFTINAHNYGPGSVDANSGLYVSDAVPSNFGPASIPPNSNWACLLGPPLTCHYIGPAVAAGGSLSPIAFTAQAIGAGTYENCAIAISPAHRDTNPGNDKACVHDTIGPRPRPYDIAIDKVDPGPLGLGQTVSFVLHSRNIGPSTVVASDGVRVVDTLPANFTSPAAPPPSSGWDCTVSGSSPPYSLTCDYAGPPVSANHTFPDITFTATATTPGTWLNCAKLALFAHADTDLHNNESCVKNEIGSPHLTISKSQIGPCLPPNQTTGAEICIFKITVTNDTPFPSAGPTTFFDTVSPAATVTLSNISSGWSCSGGSPPPLTCWTAAGVGANSYIDFTATFSIYGPALPNKNCVRLAPLGANPEVCIPIETQPRLDISKVVVQDCTGGGPNMPCEFIVRISNNGPGAYTGPLTFTDVINSSGAPTPGVSVVPPLPSGWSCTGIQPLTCASSVVSIAAGSYVDIPLSMTINGPLNADHNCASLTAPQTAGPACVPIGSTHFDLSLDSAFRVDTTNPAVHLLTYYIASTPTLVPGAQVFVHGLLTDNVVFGGTVTSSGWTCNGAWSNFTCDRIVPAGYTGGFLTLELKTSYPTSAIGQPFTYSGTATMGQNIDPNPTNNTRTVIGTLF
jgi:uncharacterized repeat protein (TIGR01451 family)